MKYSPFIIPILSALPLLSMMNQAVARNDIANFRDLKYVFTHSHPIIATLDITKCSLNDDSKPMPDFFSNARLKTI